MTILGIRFPKLYEMGNVPVRGGDETLNDFSATSLTGVPWAPGTLPTMSFVAPARYSEVRKVVFFVNVHALGAGGAVHARLRMAIPSTSTTLPLTLIPVTVTPSSSRRVIGGTGTSFNLAAFNAVQILGKTGTTSTGTIPVGTNGLTTGCFTLTVEFDRFDPACDDFFAYWDSQSDPDTYLFFRPVLENVDGNWANNSTGFHLMDYGCSVVQAPSANNKTCTIIPLSLGNIPAGAMQPDYTSGYRACLFEYLAANWDHITQVNMLSWAFWHNSNTRQFKAGLQGVSNLAPTVYNLLVEEAFSDDVLPKSSGDVTLFRSADVKSFLDDQAYHTILYDRTTGLSISTPVAFLEIIQEGFTLTECHHDGGNQYRSDTTSGTLTGSAGCPPFDPLWYQSFPDKRILGRSVFLAFSHLNVVSADEIRLHLDADFESNITALSSSSATITGIDPSLVSTPTATPGTKVRKETPNPDPIDLAGKRRLIFGIVVGTTGTTDFVGTAKLIYLLSVPASETPEIGEVFSLDAFNPDGCASTAAGLGDPGVLLLSNGSNIPKKFDPQHVAVEDAGVPTPFCDEALPTSQVQDMAVSPTGGLGAGIYRYRYTFRNCCTNKESDPSDADIVVDTSGASPAAQVTLNFTDIRIPADPQICEICLYRTVLGGDFPVMAKVGCFDPTQSVTFTDQLADSQLDFTNDGLSLLNAPPPCVPIIAEFRNRIFGMGDVPQLSPKGTVSVVDGSDIIEGDLDVEWTRCLVGKYIQVEGDCRPFEIQCVEPPAFPAVAPAYGRLKLALPYEGATRSGLLYTICGRPNRLYYSEPLLPESWPAANFLDVEPGDGDMLMGAISNFDRLVVCKRNKTYSFTFHENPALEVIVPSRISSDIGCIAARSFAQVESGSVWLSERGLALFDGRSVNLIPESTLMNDLFTNPDNPNYVRRDSNGRVIGAIGKFYPKRQEYVLLLPTKETVRGANLALVWDTVLQNVTLWKFCQEFMSLEVAKDSEGNERLYAGDTNGFVWILDYGNSDGVGFPNATGTVTGTVTDAGIDPTFGVSFIEDESASFIVGGLPGLAGLSGIPGLSAAFAGSDLGLAGVCVFFRAADAAPDDEWDSRVIFAATTTRLFVTPSFTTDAPPAGYDYMIGPIDFRAEFKPTNFGSDDMLKRDWREVVVHEVEDNTSVIRTQIIPDFQHSDDEEGTVVQADGTVGPGRTFDMAFSKGRQLRPVGRRIFNFEQIIVTNFAPESPVRLLNHVIMVEPRPSK